MSSLHAARCVRLRLVTSVPSSGDLGPCAEIWQSMLLTNDRSCRITRSVICSLWRRRMLGGSDVALRSPQMSFLWTPVRQLFAYSTIAKKLVTGLPVGRSTRAWKPWRIYLPNQPTPCTVIHSEQLITAKSGCATVSLDSSTMRSLRRVWSGKLHP